MSISAAAYNGCPSEDTLSFLLNFKSKQALALTDTGSTNTFMDRQFALKNNIALQQAPPRMVTVAGGGTLSSTEIAHNCSFSMQGLKFQGDFRILDLKGADIILGVNWFKLHNPVTFDFINRTMTLPVNGTQQKFADHLFPKKKFLISS